MKSIFYVLIAGVFSSCVYHDISIKPCYLATEETPSDLIAYHYNSQNELSSYSSSNIYSSVLTYAGGKIVTEVDNEYISIAYSYDNRNRLTLWEETFEYSPGYNSQTKFFYNSFDQDTLQQFYRYDLSTGSYYLWRYTRLEFASTGTKNYSKRSTYDGGTDTLLFTHDFLWDNRPNPYLSNAFFLNEPPPTNNMIQHSITVAGYDPQIYNYEYSYNEKGFPTERRILPDNFVITAFTYTNCN